MAKQTLQQKYNKLMNSLCLEHLTIGTMYSQGTEGWGKEEMIKEVKYQLSLYYQWGTSVGDMREDDPATWRKEVGRLKRFLQNA